MNPFYRERLRITRENGRYIAKDERSGLVIHLDGDELELAGIDMDIAELRLAAEAVRGAIPATQG